MLNPQAQKLLDLGKESGLVPVYTIPVNDARKRMRDAFVSKEEQEPVYNIENTFIPCPDYKIGLRIYRPSDKKNLPCIVFFHGGGWTLNDLDTHDGLCRSLANQVKAVIVSVDYRRSPEYKYPAPIEDAYIATEWTFANADRLKIDSKKIAVGGDSSGGTQATVVCMLARDRNTFKIKFQWLVYPVTDYYLPGTLSYQEMSIGYSMNRDFMIWFWNNYLPPETNLNNPYLCPLRSNDFSNLPPAFIMTANYDPLRDEAEIYAERLRNANVKVKLCRYKDQMHGFLMQRKNIDAANIAFNDAVKELINGLL
jgi:acetyl esterase